MKSTRKVALLAAATTITIGAMAVYGATALVPGAPVPIGTGPERCYLSSIDGDLVTDPDTGTAIIEGGQRVPVIWQPGWTGRRSPFGEVVILDSSGRTLGRTGTHVRIGGGYPPQPAGTWLGCWIDHP
jgi:hypothetical protein